MRNFGERRQLEPSPLEGPEQTANSVQMECSPSGSGVVLYQKRVNPNQYRDIQNNRLKLMENLLESDVKIKNAIGVRAFKSICFVRLNENLRTICRTKLASLQRWKQLQTCFIRYLNDLTFLY